MERHLERRIILSDQSELKSLYSWFVKEVAEDGATNGRDQIPWAWTQRFRATSIELVKNLGVDRYSIRDDGDTAPPVDKSSIRCRLVPDDGDDHLAYSSTRYSMFGTDRHIEDFTLQIAVVDEGKDEGLRAWGGISYTTDIDFRDITTPDSLMFYLAVSADRFAEYVRQIESRTIDSAGLRIGMVEGFYSDWSPGISTNSIKVLTGYEKDQPVEIPEGVEIKPPRLGKVGEFEFHTVRQRELSPPLPTQDASTDAPDFEDEPERPVAVPASTGRADRTDKLLASIRVAAWVIAAVLVLILLKG